MGDGRSELLLLTAAYKLRQSDGDHQGAAIKHFLDVASGFLGALAGILYAGTQGAADPVSGVSYQLPAFAAAFLGSTCIAPGRFNPWGATVAVYFLVTGITGLVFLGFSSFIRHATRMRSVLTPLSHATVVRARCIPGDTRQKPRSRWRNRIRAALRRADRQSRRS